MSALPSVSPDLTLDLNQEIVHGGLIPAASADASSARLGGLIPGRYRAAVRLNGSHLEGRNSILSQTDTYVVGLSDALRHLSDFTTLVSGDIFLVQSPLLVTHLPPAATVYVRIFAGGVTFPDGTTEKTLTQADLDANGTYTLEFLMPRVRLGAPCHYVNVLDENGRILWDSAD